MKPRVAALRRTLGQNRIPTFSFNREAVAQTHSTQRALRRVEPLQGSQAAGPFITEGALRDPRLCCRTPSAFKSTLHRGMPSALEFLSPRSNAFRVGIVSPRSAVFAEEIGRFVGGNSEFSGYRLP